MFLSFLLLLSAPDPDQAVCSGIEAKFELLKIKKNYATLYPKCKTQDQKIVVFVAYENLIYFQKLLKELPSNTLYCYTDIYEGISAGVVIGQYNKGALERISDLHPDKINFEPKPKVKVDRVHYPIRDHFWTGCSDWTHMLSGVHAKQKFDPAWLKSLSWAELQSLHSDDHEGLVKWSNVVKRP